MKSVAVNLLWLVPGVVGGSEEYTVRLLDSVAATAPDDLDLTLVAQPTLLDAHPQLGEQFSVRSLPLEVATKPLRFGVESAWLATLGRRFDVIHHGGGVVPLASPCPSVVTVHDLQPLDLPQNFSAFQQQWFAVMLPRVVRKARIIVTPSNFTADRLAERLGADRDRIVVVPPVHQSPASTTSPATDATLVGPDGQSITDYVLYPAISHHHKRHIDAVEAIHVLRERRPDLHLVFTGADGAAAEGLSARITELGLGDRVHHLGRVSPDRLETLWAGTRALVFPSVYEGFGNPVLEAMARSVPVIAADATALPEVAGGAAALVEPRSPVALADGLDTVLADQTERARLIRLGQARADEFGPEQAAAALLSAYRDALR